MGSNDNKRIVKNTLMLYTRQILILLVSLYTVRVVLNVLGVEDYGIYSVVGGIVAFFSFLSNTMASATQRFFSIALGENNEDKLKKTFIVNLIIYLAIAGIALLLLETVGFWYVKEQLNVPMERFESAQILFHYSVLTFLVTIFATPFMAIIIAHEDMQIYAYVSIIESVLKLGMVILLIYLPWDKLELYGILILVVAFINSSIYIVICNRKYLECQFHRFYWDKQLLFEITNFTSWTLFGQLTTVIRNQGVTILLNQVFNPVVVAARAIAMNVTGNINMFSNNFNTGLYPPIIKAYANGRKKEMLSLIFNGSLITFFLMWVFTLPLILEMDAVLKIWLKKPPFEAVLFTRLALIEVLINSISLPLTTAARAPGKMKVYELVLGSIQISILVVAWIVLKIGGEAYMVFVVAIIANIIMFIVRLFILRNLISLPLEAYFFSVIIPVLKVIVLSLIPTILVHELLPKGLFYTGISVLLCMMFASIIMYFVGLSKEMRIKVRSVLINKINKIIRNE